MSDAVQDRDPEAANTRENPASSEPRPVNPPPPSEAAAEQALTTRALPEPVVKRGIPEAQWRLMFNLWPGAKPDMALMVWDYCKARGLDPMKKPCHIVPVRVKQNGQWVDRDVVMAGIAEHRITAHRTGTYLGHSRPEYGPVTAYGAAGTYAGVSAPEWCAMTFYRQHRAGASDARVIEFPVMTFFAEVVTTDRDGKVNSRWTRAPRQMLTKCTEAAGLREGWPEELGGEPTVEELEGQSDEPLAVVAARAPEPQRRSAKPIAEVQGEVVPEGDDVDQIFGPADGTRREEAAPAPAAAAAPARSAAPARRASAAPVAPEGPQTTTNMLVMETVMVSPRGGAAPYYEITASVSEKGRAPIGYVFLTSDKATYEQAASCEGTGALLNMTWKAATKPDGKPCKVLETIAAAD